MSDDLDLSNGAVLTKGPAVVNVELDGDSDLFFMSNVAGILDTERASFDSRQDRDAALENTVRLFLDEGWQLAGVES